MKLFQIYITVFLSTISAHHALALLSTESSRDIRLGNRGKKGASISLKLSFAEIASSSLER